MIPEETAAPAQRAPGRFRQVVRRYLPDVLLLLVLILGAYLRFTGINWDDGTHLHPDERFLTIVESELKLPNSLSAYFNTAQSPLNPVNTGNTFFVYGTLPIFLVRVVGGWLGQTGYDQIYLIGRAASASFEIITIFLLFLLGKRLYDRRVGLLAAAFFAVAVLPIQHAHFFVVDPFADTFIVAGLYFAVRSMDEGGYWNYLAFGLALGMGTASKITTAPLALAMPVIAAIRYMRADFTQKPSVLSHEIKAIALAAAASFLSFRVFQPYAFIGTSFFDIRPDSTWINTMLEIHRQQSGAVDFPPALQWADRLPVWFSLRNMVLWGLGLPLGVTAWIGWGWAGLQTIKKHNWERHILPVAWTGGFFLWQSTGFTKAMRYQLPIYPTLALLASWAIWQAWDRLPIEAGRAWLRRSARPIVGLLGGGVLAATVFYAFAFVHIYQAPMTRVAASEWIYHNLPTSVDLVLGSAGSLEPVPASQNLVLEAGDSKMVSFIAKGNGALAGFNTPTVTDLASGTGPKQLRISLYDTAAGGVPLASGLTADLTGLDHQQVWAPVANSVPIIAGHTYGLQIELQGQGAVELDGDVTLSEPSGGSDQTSRAPIAGKSLALAAGTPQTLVVRANQSGDVTAVRMAYVRTLAGAGTLTGMHVRLFRQDQPTKPIAEGSWQGSFDPSGTQDINVPLDQSASIQTGQTYLVELTLEGQGAAALRPSVLVSETSWDDGLPVSIGGYDYGSRYTGVNQELYWPDNQDDNADGVPDKLARIVDTLNQGDYLIITSNRQYGSIGRVPERYPLTVEYYRLLFHCPAPEAINQCAAVAQPGKVNNSLGYKLIDVFQSDPTLLGVDFNDQTAEEAFTVYDHPKVFIFAKTPQFSAKALQTKLAAVNVSQVQNLAPKDLKAGTTKTLMLTPAQRTELQANGTWQVLFPASNPLNRSGVLAVVVWWFTIAVVGWLAFPIVRLAFPGLKSKGYPLARLTGLLLVAWGSWMLGSFGVPVHAITILAVIVMMGLVSGVLAWRDRVDLQTFFKEHWREVLWVEALALTFFLIDLGIRLGNPDLWHPSKGGEKPMDLSYLTAVLKSDTFPPYDPWFAGGYINYYYFGFVLVGMPIKLLGIVPETAYNLVLPTLFSMLALGGYTAGYALVDHTSGDGRTRLDPRLAGVGAALLLVLFGNLGNVKLIYDTLKSAGAGPGPGLVDAARGLIHVLLLQAPFQVPIDQWYWNASRSIPPGPGEPGPITEFPFFTFLYADLHAHMISLPITVTGLTWAVSWVFANLKSKMIRWLDQGVAIFVGALILGALRPTNTWDFPVYLGLGALATLSVVWVRKRAFSRRAVLPAVVTTGALLALAFLLYQPYAYWYGQGYTQAIPWTGGVTPISAYLTVWGVFLFLIVTWMIWETHEWMAGTPLSSLSPVRPYAALLASIFVVFMAAVVLATLLVSPVALIVFPLILWAGVLFLRPDQPVEKRIVLLLVGAGAALTFVVEVVVLKGDIGRMNTVFKFYMQVWTLFSISAAAAFGWVLADLAWWRPGWRNVWGLAVALLVFGALLYPLTAAPAKIEDRMAQDAPHTLNGMAFMAYATQYELGQPFSTLQDDRAIQWMRDNIVGSPTIVEASIPEYRWGNVFAIYTGLPAVVGWHWHQEQQRVVAGDQQVTDRVLEVTAFYEADTVDQAMAFIHKYDVKYVVVSPVEEIYFGDLRPCWASPSEGTGVTCDMSGRALGTAQPNVQASECTSLDPSANPPTLDCPTHGLDKFPLMVRLGDLSVAFHTGQTTIYKVMR